MTKLHQVLAIEKGVRNSTHTSITELDRVLSKPAMTTGITRTYAKKDDTGDDLPSESTLVQVRVLDALRSEGVQLTRLWDTVATKEYANTGATADVVTEDGTTVAAGVPVTALLFFEKQLNDLHTLVGRLPILDPQFEWEWDANRNCYVTAVQQTQRTKKIPRAFTKAEATPQHPAQVEMFSEDVIVGFWNTTHLSGAIPASVRQAMIERVESLQRAVKQAREKANDIEVQPVSVGANILSYVFPEIAGARN